MVDPTAVVPPTPGQPTSGREEQPALPVGTAVGRLLAEAQRQAERLESAVDAVAEALEVRGAGRARVGDVLDLLADGQGELLVAQEAASGQLRRQVGVLTEALEASVAQLQAAAEAARGGTSTVVDALATAGDATARSLTDAADRLAAAAQRLVAGVEEELQVAIARVDAHVQQAADRLEQAAAAGARRVEEVAATSATTLAEAAGESIARVEHLSAVTADRLEQVAVEAATRVERLAASSADRLEQVALDVAGRVEDVTASSTEQLHAVAESGAAALTDAVHQGVSQLGQVFSDELVRTGRGVAAEVDGALARLDAGVVAFDDALRESTQVAAGVLQTTAEAARDDVTAAVLESRQELAADRDAWRAKLAKMSRQAESLTVAAAERLETASVGIADSIEQAATGATHDLVTAVEAAGAQADSFRVELVELLQRWDDREVARDKRVEARVAKLEARADAATKAAADRLAKVTDALLARDRQLEAERVEEFVRVLDDVLSRSGASGRDVRARIRKALAGRDLEEGP